MHHLCCSSWWPADNSSATMFLVFLMHIWCQVLRETPRGHRFHTRPHSETRANGFCTLRPPAAPYTALLLFDRTLLNRHVILHYTIPKPYITLKGYMVLVCCDKVELVFSNSFDQRAKLLIRGVLVALIIGWRNDTAYQDIQCLPCSILDKSLFLQLLGILRLLLLAI